MFDTMTYYNTISVSYFRFARKSFRQAGETHARERGPASTIADAT